MTKEKIKLKWHTEKRKVNALAPYDKNPRRITEQQETELKRSLEKFDLVEIPAIDADDTILAGHQRIAILKTLGRENEVIEARVPNRKLTDAEYKEYNLRSNKNTGEWDYDLLALCGEDLLLDVGFSSEDIDKILNGTQKGNDDSVPETKKTNIKTGDLFKLGNHRLLCGDCTIKENVERLMDGKKSDMIFTDPPYGIDLDTDYTSLNSKPKFVQEKPLKMKTGNKYKKVIGDNEDYNPEHILRDFGKCKEIFLWGGDYFLKRLPDNGSLFVWDKRQTEQLDKMYGSCFELCWSKNKHKREIIRHTWAGIFGTKKEDIKYRIHPTQKPIGLCEWFINKFSKRGQNIIDIFGGSGSTLIACEKTNRVCYIMELDPLYCQTIKDRWEEYTGHKAEQI